MTPAQKEKALELKKRRNFELGEPMEEKKVLTIDEFIQQGYLLRALDLPAEGCNTLLSTILPEHDIPIVPTDRGINTQINHALDKAKKRQHPTATMSVQDRLNQISPLVEVIMRDVEDVANLDRIPVNIIQRARCSIWLAMSYCLFAVFEPESILVPMLQRLT